MFDSVGQDLDRDAPGRSARSAAIVSGLVGCVAGLVVATGGWTMRPTPFAQPDDEDIFVVMMPDPVDDTTLVPPSLPAAPPPSSTSAGDVPRTEPADEPPDEVPELEDAVDDRVEDAEGSAGDEEGVDGGDPDGAAGGRVGGDPRGEPGGTGTGEPRRVHHSDLRVVSRVQPRYPTAAKGLGLGRQSCIAVLHIDADGVPVRVGIDGCPPLFHGPTREALLGWRWELPRELADGIGVQTKVIVTFVE